MPNIAPPIAYPYSPTEHLLTAGIHPIYRDQLPAVEMVAAYSPDTDAIYIRRGLSPVVERCALTHELSHWEHQDTGREREAEEYRAETTAAVRLIPATEYERTVSAALGEREAAYYLGVTVTLFRRFRELYESGEYVDALAAHGPETAIHNPDHRDRKLK